MSTNSRDHNAELIPLPPYHNPHNPRHDLPRGGQPPPDRTWYAANFTDFYSNTQLIRGFNLTHTEHEAATLWLISALKDAGLARAPHQTKAQKVAFDDVLWRFERGLPRLVERSVSTVWRGSAVWGWVKYAQIRLAEGGDGRSLRDGRSLQAGRSRSGSGEVDGETMSADAEGGTNQGAEGGGAFGSPNKKRKWTHHHPQSGAKLKIGKDEYPRLRPFKELALRFTLRSGTAATISSETKTATIWLEDIIPCETDARGLGAGGSRGVERKMDLDVTTLDFQALMTRLSEDRAVRFQQGVHEIVWEKPKDMGLLGAGTGTTGSSKQAASGGDIRARVTRALGRSGTNSSSQNTETAGAGAKANGDTNGAQDQPKTEHIKLTHQIAMVNAIIDQRFFVDAPRLEFIILEKEGTRGDVDEETGSGRGGAGGDGNGGDAGGDEEDLCNDRDDGGRIDPRLRHDGSNERRGARGGTEGADDEHDDDNEGVDAERGEAPMDESQDHEDDGERVNRGEGAKSQRAAREVSE